MISAHLSGISPYHVWLQGGIGCMKSYLAGGFTYGTGSLRQYRDIVDGCEILHQLMAYPIIIPWFTDIYSVS